MTSERSFESVEAAANELAFDAADFELGEDGVNFQRSTIFWDLRP